MRVGLLWTTLAISACATVSDTDGDSDTDRVIDEPACTYPELAGDWTSDKITSYTQGEVDGQSALTMYEHAEVGAASGTARFQFNLGGGEVLCFIDLTCTDRDQNEWKVFVEELLPGSMNCYASYSFLRLESDGTLRLESAEGEFAPRTNYVIFERAD